MPVSAIKRGKNLKNSQTRLRISTLDFIGLNKKCCHGVKLCYNNDNEVCAVSCESETLSRYGVDPCFPTSCAAVQIEATRKTLMKNFYGKTKPEHVDGFS